ncbi:hypothetical protein QV65_25485 [Rhodococcus erythropolis]|nr:hypothetical protein QV65_25485 [Rhodococcus erythropolis]
MRRAAGRTHHDLEIDDLAVLVEFDHVDSLEALVSDVRTEFENDLPTVGSGELTVVLEILEHLDHRIENEHNGIRGLVRLESGGRSELRVGRDNGR